MKRNPSINSPSRRNFLTTTTGVLAAAMVAPGNIGLRRNNSGRTSIGELVACG